MSSNCLALHANASPERSIVVLQRYAKVDPFHPLLDPHAASERLAEWADEARRAGRIARADRLLLLAWEAYDRPARDIAGPESAPGQTSASGNDAA